MNQTGALLPLRRVDPDARLSEWLAELELSAKSEGVYLSMFSKFFSWMGREGLTLEGVTAGDIDEFLNKNGLVKEHRYRYVRLIERFYIHLSAKKILKRDNPGSRAAQAKVGEGRNDRTQFLSAPEIDAIARYIAPGPLEGKKEKQENRNPGPRAARDWREFAEWREARDKALASGMLFGALKVSEAASLSVNCITEDAVKVPRVGRVPEREAYLLPAGRDCLAAWLKIRGRANIAGRKLFPADDLGESMHPASIYRRVHRVAQLAFEQAGLEVPEARLSPQTLRNTYAAMLIEGGHSNAVIMASMGIKESASISRLRMALNVAKTSGG